MSVPSGDESQIRALYVQLMNGWNAGDGAAFAAAFADDGELVGFDGTHHRGRDEIARSHQVLFDKWLKGTRLIGSVESVRFVSADVAVVRAHGGTILGGKSQPAPERASIQTLVATRAAGTWRLAAFHNTRIRPMGAGFGAFLHWSIGDRLWRLLRIRSNPQVVEPAGDHREDSP